jgi:FkbM family methyltransferase
MPSLREVVKSGLLKRGIVLSRPPGQFNVEEVRLRKAKSLGLDVRVAVDGGAATGDWTRQFKAIWPDAQVVCVEPRDDAQGALKALASEMKGIHVAQTLLSATEGTVEFHVNKEQSSILGDFAATAGVASASTGTGNAVPTPATTLDALVRRLGLPDPDLIKLDLQGAELMALEGATRCLQSAQAVLLEVSFLQFMKGIPLVGEVVPYMTARGFRVYDILALWQRPLDGALAQGDFLFVSERSGLVGDARWDRSK